jgi:hypothetical protein
VTRVTPEGKKPKAAMRRKRGAKPTGS